MRQFALKGITWNHSRALPPLVAAAQRFEELNPRVTIQWEKRTLHEFGHASLRELAQSFDLLVVDHPMMGDASADGLLLDLKALLGKEEWRDMKSDSAGNSFQSYVYDDRLYALPIDAAAPAASLRLDLLQETGCTAPSNWDEIIELARRGLVRMPGFPADAFLNFVGMCVSSGSQLATRPDILLDREIALICLEKLRELSSWMPEEIFSWNPIVLYERMSSTDEFAYCPFAYTYSNYSRVGFAPRLLHFTPSSALGDRSPMRTVLGGTGLAISSFSSAPDIGLEYGLYVSGSDCQRTLYGVCGGQPARRSAWEDEELNRLTNRFFRNTLSSIETAILRPRYPGYVQFQEKAGVPLVQYLKEGGKAESVIDSIDALYRSSRRTLTPYA